MTFSQQNRLTTHFSECIPVAKRHMTYSDISMVHTTAKTGYGTMAGRL